MTKTGAILLLLSIAALFTGCVKKVVHYGWEEKIDEYSFSNIVLTYAVELQKEKNLKLEDSQVYYKDAVDRIDLVFSTQSILEVKEARELLVDVVEGFLERLENDTNVFSQLSDSFSASNLEIHINLESYWPLYGDPFYVGWIVLENGMAWYYAADLKNFYQDFWHVRCEPYYKSLEFVTIERAAYKDYELKHKPPEPKALLKERAYHLGETPQITQQQAVLPAQAPQPATEPNAQIPTVNLENAFTP